MRILHVGSGYRPLRWGGLVAYVEDLMAEQVRRGDTVHYFFSGRYFRWPRDPRIKRWERDGVAMIEVVNSPLYDHGRQPLLELDEPRIEALFAQVLDEVEPDVVHVQELAGLPSSLLDLAAASGTPVVMTLQDYFPLCSTFKLLDADGEVCLRREIGADCATTLAADPRPGNLLYEGTMRHAMNRRRATRALGESLTEMILQSRLTQPAAPAPAPAPADFQRRREVNLERLNRVDRLVGMSSRVSEIYTELGIEPTQVQTMHLTLAHIDRLTPRTPTGEGPVTFATLGGGEGIAKGSRLIAQAARALATEAAPRSWRLLIFGQCEPELARVVDSIAEVELRGTFGPSRLDGLLDEVDVGIMSSIWEEAYGYAGIEFIAKGIPVLSNRIGGMVDYVFDGETGWLNRSNSGDGLARVMLELIANPQTVVDVAASVRAARDRLVTSMPDHATAVDALYREVA